MLYGSPRTPGYLNRKRAVGLDVLGMPLPDHSISVDTVPAEFLREFEERKQAHYDGQFMVYHSSKYGYISVPMVCRGSRAYRARVGDNFDWLKDFMAAYKLPAVHCRLSPEARYGKSPLDSLLDMYGLINKFISYVESRLGYRPLYLWCKEPTKRGHCHYHVLFIGQDWLLPKEEIDAWFKKQGLGDARGVYIEALRACPQTYDKVVGYLVKYVSKPSADPYWAGLLSLTRAREWGMSNRLSDCIRVYKRQVSMECTSAGSSRIGVTNSKKCDRSDADWKVVGRMSDLECEVLLTDNPPTFEELVGVEVPYLDLNGEVACVKREGGLLSEIRGAAAAVNSGRWHFPSQGG